MVKVISTKSNAEEDKVAGTTCDGLVVHESEAKLVFSPWNASWVGFYFGFRFQIECNRNPSGNRRPYYVLTLFGLSLTGGWLFESVRQEVE